MSLRFPQRNHLRHFAAYANIVFSRARACTCVRNALGWRARTRFSTPIHRKLIRDKGAFLGWHFHFHIFSIYLFIFFFPFIFYFYYYSPYVITVSRRRRSHQYTCRAHRDPPCTQYTSRETSHAEKRAFLRVNGIYRGVKPFSVRNTRTAAGEI
jgi:hypothetical protein